MDTKERLVKTMGQLMWERGYADTSPRDVRELSGVGQGSLYHHFPTKRDLAVAALEHNIAEVMPAATELDGPGDALQRMERYLLQPRDALKGCRVGRMTQDPQVREDPVLLAPISEAFTKVHGHWVCALQDAIDAGELPEDADPEVLAHTLMAVIQGGYVLAMAQRDPAPFNAAIQGAIALLRASGPQQDQTKESKEGEGIS